MTENKIRICLNLYKVRERMERQGITKRALSKDIGMKDYHTLSYYFKRPDRIRLEHVTAIAEVLGCSSFPEDEYILRTRNDEEFEKMINEED